MPACLPVDLLPDSPPYPTLPPNATLPSNSTRPALPACPARPACPALPRLQELKARTRMAVSSQFNALDLNKAPKFGFGYNINY